MKIKKIFQESRLIWNNPECKENTFEAVKSLIEELQIKNDALEAKITERKSCLNGHTNQAIINAFYTLAVQSHTVMVRIFSKDLWIEFIFFFKKSKGGFSIERYSVKTFCAFS